MRRDNILFLFFITYGLLFGMGCGKRIYAQTQRQKLMDSLQNELNRQREDSGKVKILLNLAQIAPDSQVLKYSFKAIKLSDRLNYKYGQIKSRLITGTYYSGKKQLIALNYLSAAQKLAQNFDNPLLLAICDQALARHYYHVLNTLPEALRNVQKAIPIFIKTGKEDLLCQSYALCGMIYNEQEENKDALSYLNKAIAIAKKLKDSSSIAYSDNAIAGILLQTSQWDKALKYSKEALSIYQSLGTRAPVWGGAWTYGYIGNSYYQKGNDAWEKGDKEDARSLFAKAFKIYSERLELELKITSGSTDSYLDLANWYLRMIELKEAPSVKDYAALAGNNLKKCIRNAEQDHSLSILASAYSSLIVLDSINGNYDQGCQHIQMYVLMQDSADRRKNSDEAVKLKMQYDFNQKEAVKKAELAKKDIRRRNIRNSVAFGFTGALFFLVVVYRQRNKMAKAKKHSNELLLNILPEEIAEEIKIKGHAEAKQFDEVSVLFTDFVHFTQTSEKLSPQELVYELNECFTAFDNIIERNGMEKIKTIGDAYMAVCGLPNVNSKHAQNTVKAALEIRDFIENRNREKGTFQIRIGVHSGPVVAGIVGVKKFAYDIWGNTVNTAIQMEGNGKPGKVNISDATYQLVKNDFECSHRGKLNAKGKGEVDMYFVS